MTVAGQTLQLALGQQKNPLLGIGKTGTKMCRSVQWKSVKQINGKVSNGSMEKSQTDELVDTVIHRLSDRGKTVAHHLEKRQPILRTQSLLRGDDDTTQRR